MRRWWEELWTYCASPVLGGSSPLGEGLSFSMEVLLDTAEGVLFNTGFDMVVGVASGSSAGNTPDK